MAVSRRIVWPAMLAGAALAGSALRVRPGTAQPGSAPARDFQGIAGWINTDAPLSIAALRGRVVLVDFWTYSCINCRRTVPYLNRWQAEYGAMGLQVIGVHTPEFGFERMRPNVEDSVRAFGIRFPVAQDNSYATWRAWRNRAWPAFYVLDRDGRIVLLREGEGHAREMESAIRSLLGLPPSATPRPDGDDADLSLVATPEMYFGAQHGTPQDRTQRPRPGVATYALGRAGPQLNEYQLDGAWQREDEALRLQSAHGGLRVRFSAAKLHLVAEAPDGATLRVRVDGGTVQTVEIRKPTLYTLLDGDRYGEHVLEFETDAPGLALFSATFG